MAYFGKECTMQKNNSKYPNTYYRVTVKGIIRDDRGFILAVKEGSDNWSLPGGGIDHGETLDAALAREMYEETLITQTFSSVIVGTDSFFVTDKEAYLMWVVCELKFKEPIIFGTGQDANDVQLSIREHVKAANTGQNVLFINGVLI